MTDRCAGGMIRIRPLRHEELGDAVALVLRVFDAQVAASFTPEGAKLFREASPAENAKGLGRGDICLVAEESNRLVGVLRMTRKGHLHTLFVEGERQGHGIGRNLLQAAIAEIKSLEEPPEKITLKATDNAIDIYRHWGFSATGPAFDRKGMRATPMEAHVETLA